MHTLSSLPTDVSVLLIEHDMDLVFEFAQRITVLVNGAVLVEGNPAQIEQNEQVRAVYLGHGEATA
jgi:branched-chain amino acid transport system ATP-binding protein